MTKKYYSIFEEFEKTLTPKQRKYLREQKRISLEGLAKEDPENWAQELEKWKRNND